MCSLCANKFMAVIVKGNNGKKNRSVLPGPLLENSAEYWFERFQARHWSIRQQAGVLVEIAPQEDKNPGI